MQQADLLIFIGTAIIKVEHPGSAELCNCRFHDRHQVYEVILEKDINANDKTAGIINQCVIDTQQDLPYPDAESYPICMQAHLLF